MAVVTSDKPTYDLVVEPRSGEHECNFYCSGDIHARILYHDGPIPEGEIVGIITSDRRDDVISMRLAPEVPPVDPSDPLQRSWSHRYLVLAKARGIRD